MQNYHDLQNTEAANVYLDKVKDNIQAVASNFSGTSFPTENLQVGMLCYRTDKKKLYQLTDTDPITWESVQSSLTFDTTPTAGSTNPVTSGGVKTALDRKLSLTGGNVTGNVTASAFKTGTDASNYFQCMKFRGEGDASTYYHAIDFGYKTHDQVDFHEYGGIWNFYQNTTGKAYGGSLVGSIQPDGWHGNVIGNVTGNASSATKAKQDASGNVITSTYATKASIPTKTSELTNDSNFLTSHQNLDGYAKKSTTLSGYGITDANISDGTITLGKNSITPLTSHQDLSAYLTKADASTNYLGKYATAYAAAKAELDWDGNVIANTYASKASVPTKTSQLTNDSEFLNKEAAINLLKTITLEELL